MLKHNVLDGIIWKTRSQCLGTGMTKESSVKHWNDTLYGLLNYNYKCLRNLPNKKKAKKALGLLSALKYWRFLCFKRLTSKIKLLLNATNLSFNI
ncbi:hypothetical protein [Wolbachia endosymbiont (group A) of Anomoia purmunda]|uniref:hypothetical protein n=1 Tax=Wolbachia endosymbiont (group A) of Anomoia purmunda TaxID=2953978 RepID=UPI002231313C|nr:hypothetical protein [Wolbachia endosymbiont (group A) of Anomoia purmunda]